MPVAITVGVLVALVTYALGRGDGIRHERERCRKETKHWIELGELLQRRDCTNGDEREQLNEEILRKVGL